MITLRLNMRVSINLVQQVLFDEQKPNVMQKMTADATMPY